MFWLIRTEFGRPTACTYCFQKPQSLEIVLVSQALEEATHRMRNTFKQQSHWSQAQGPPYLSGQRGAIKGVHSNVDLGHEGAVANALSTIEHGRLGQSVCKSAHSYLCHCRKGGSMVSG